MILRLLFYANYIFNFFIIRDYGTLGKLFLVTVSELRFHTGDKPNKTSEDFNTVLIKFNINGPD